MASMPAWIVSQFGKPTGPLGHLAGLIMSARASNRLRSRATVDLLDVRPGQRVLEIGFGPGLAVELLAERVGGGQVVGVDHSEAMLGQATRRNARAIRDGRVRLILGSAEALPASEAPFDRIVAVNVFMFWEDPAAVLARIRSHLAPDGVLALTLQPRRPGATADDTRAAAARMVAALGSAGFGPPRVEILDLPPVPAACVLAGRGAGLAVVPHQPLGDGHRLG